MWNDAKNTGKFQLKFYLFFLRNACIVFGYSCLVQIGFEIIENVLY